MSVIDIENLLQPISADQTSGDNLEYDPTYLEMQEAARGKEPKYAGKDIIEPAVPPDWPQVRQKSLELLSRSKDLVVAVNLARALLHTDGFVGFQDGLALLRGLLDKYWDSIHPQLDPGDKDDPTRINTLITLCELETVLHRVRDIPLIESPRAGRFSLHDVHVAQGVLPPQEGREAPNMAVIDATFKNEKADVDALKGTLDAVNSCLVQLSAIGAIFADKVGPLGIPNFDPLTKLLSEIKRFLSERLPQSEPSNEATAQAQTAGGSGTIITKSDQGIVPGKINSRDDVLRALDQICEYFDRNEPSSPVPLLLKRARRLVSKDFISILKDLVPDGVKQAELFRGAESKD